MKKIVLAVILFSSFFTGPAFSGQWIGLERATKSIMEPSVESSSQSGIVIKFTLPGFEQERVTTDMGEFQQLTIPGAGQSWEVGKPNLPVFSQMLAIPPTTGIKVTVLSATHQTLKGYKIYPVQDPLPDIKNAPRPVFRKDAAVYSTDTFYPANPVTVTEPALIRDLRVVSLLYNPIQFNPATGEVRICGDIKIQIDFVGSDPRNVPERTGLMTKDFSDMLSGTVINKDQFIDQSKAFQTSGKYYIIVVDSLYNSIKPLAQWRQRMGYTTVVDSFSKINTGAADTVDIKNAVKNAYNNWGVEYVLLVGDHAGPNNEAMLPSIKGNFSGYSYNPIPHDHGYSLTSGSDFYSDVMLGRIPAQTKAQCDTMVTKIMRYERNPYMDNPNWFHRAVLLGSYETGRIFIDTGRNIRQRLIASGFDQVDTLFEKPTKPGLLINTNIDTSLEAGRSFLLFRGHGSELDAATGPGYTAYFGGADQNYRDAYRDNDFASLNNGQMNGVAIAPTCLAADYAEDQGSAPHRVMAEYFFNYLSGTTPRSMGTAGYFGAMDVSYSFYNDSLSQGIFHHILDSNHTKFQQACNGGKLFMLKYYPGGSGTVTQYEFYFMTIAGDPAMDLWTATPDSFACTYATAIGVGSQSYSVNVKRKTAGTNVRGAKVCVMMDDLTVYAVDTTDASGNVSLTINPATSGTMYVTVTKHNFRPHEGSCTVSSGSPYAPTQTKLFNSARVPDLRPILSFTASDPQGDAIQYRVVWDTLPSFPAPDSATTSMFASGAQASFTFPSSLLSGRVYFWKVKGRDPSGTNKWGPYSQARSLAVETSMPSNSCSWFQGCAAQFGEDALSGMRLVGDTMILNTQSVTDTVYSTSFEGTWLPVGWDTSSIVAYSNFITQVSSGTYPTCSPYSGSSMVKYNCYNGSNGTRVRLISKPVYIGSSRDTLNFCMTHDPGYSSNNDRIVLEIKYKPMAGVWSAWTAVDSFSRYQASQAWVLHTKALGSYINDSVRVSFTGHSAYGNNIFLDDVYIASSHIANIDSGTVTTKEVSYADLNGTYTRSNWGYIHCKKKTAADSVGIQVQYQDGGVWALIPNNRLSSNSTGFFNAQQYVTVDLTGLSTTTYDTIRVVATLRKGSFKGSADPALCSVETGSTSQNPLAVTMASFAATADGRAVRLTWRTESEAECYQWDIERSSVPDGGFESIGLVDGHGTTNDPHDYEYLDMMVAGPGCYYYRLAEVELSGRKTYYGPVEVDYQPSAALCFRMAPLSPNPCTGSMTIHYSLAQPGHTALVVYNVLGQEVRTLVDGDQRPDRYQVTWDGYNRHGQTVASGVYLVKLRSGTYQALQRLTVLR